LESLKKRDHSVEDNIKMDVEVIRCKGVDWIHLAQDMYRWRALVNMAMNLRVP
jgi:hypothetical protein